MGGFFAKMAKNSSEMARNCSEMARSSEHGYIENIDWISNKTYIIMIYIFNIACTRTEHADLLNAKKWSNLWAVSVAVTNLAL